MILSTMYPQHIFYRKIRVLVKGRARVRVRVRVRVALGLAVGLWLEVSSRVMARG